MTIHDEQIMQTLADAVAGNKYAEQDVIQYLESKIMGKRIGKYLGKNRAVENEDLKQEFLIGASLAISKCRMDIGDPMEYIIAQGVYRVKSYLRKSVISSTAQICNECGYITRLNRIGTDYICKKCGSSNISTHEVNDHNEIILQNAVSSSLAVEDEAASNVMIEQFEKTLTRDTNVYNLYMILKSGTNRDNPEVVNYIKTIAGMWGCSEQNVVQILGKLQQRVLKFAANHGMIIINNKFVEEEQ